MAWSRNPQLWWRLEKISASVCRYRIIALVLAAPLLGAASCDTDPPKLSAIPAPPPVIVHVPTYLSLPADATSPCAEPQQRPIRTDVDLYTAAMAWKVTARCANGKLQAIEAVQP